MHHVNISIPINLLFALLVFTYSCASTPEYITSNGKKHKVMNKGYTFSITIQNNTFKPGPIEYIQSGKKGGINNLSPACRLSSTPEFISQNPLKFKVISHNSLSVGSFYENEMIAQSVSGKTSLTCWHDKNKRSHLTVDDLNQVFGKIAIIK